MFATFKNIRGTHVGTLSNLRDEVEEIETRSKDDRWAGLAERAVYEFI